MAYLTLQELQGLTLAPSNYIDTIEQLEPAWIDNQLAYWSAWMDSRLSKRYAAPFKTPYPVAVTGWLARILDERIYLKRGVDASDAQYAAIAAAAAEARAEIKEAADSREGLFELPLRADTDAQGISRGTPLSYTEQSPYRWTSLQRKDGRAEDQLDDE